MDSFKGIKICYLADKHDLFDDRIYWKMAVPMKRRGAEVYFFLIGPREEEGITSEGIVFKMMKVKTYASNPYLNFATKRLNPVNNYEKLFVACARLRADIYHFHDLWLNRLGPRIQKLDHDPVVFYDAREPYAEDYRNLYGSGRFSKFIIEIFASWVDRWEKRKALNYDLVIATESKVRNAFAEVLGEEKTLVLYNYLDLDFFEEDLDVNEDGQDGNHMVTESRPYHLLYCGLLTEQRGAWNLLEAIRLLKPQVPNLKVLLLGKVDPPALRDEMKAYIQSHDLQNTIEMKTQVPYDEVGKYYRASRIGLLLWQPVSNLKIKMPIKLFEYMAFGLPVIGSNFGHIAEMIKKEDCGVLVNPEKPEEIAKVVELLLKEKQMYARMSRNGIQVTRSTYNWKRELQYLCTSYKKAIDGR